MRNSHPFCVLVRGVHFPTFNVRTLYQTGKLDQLLRGAQNLSLNIIGIQESWWITWRKQSHNTGTTIVSLCSSILLPPNLGSLVLGYWIATSLQTHTGLLKVPKRILKVYFEGTPLAVVYVIYAPTDVANDIKKPSWKTSTQVSPRSNLTPLMSSLVILTMKANG